MCSALVVASRSFEILVCCKACEGFSRAAGGLIRVTGCEGVGVD